MPSSSSSSSSLSLLAVSLVYVFFSFPRYNNIALAGSDLIQDTCKQATYYDLCVNTLSKDQSSPPSDVKGLVLNALKATQDKANTMAKEIHNMIGQNNDSFITQCLNECWEHYDDTLDHIHDSLESLESAAYDKVIEGVVKAMEGANSCEGGFKGQPGYKSLLTTENNEFYMLCRNDMNLIKYLASKKN